MRILLADEHAQPGALELGKRRRHLAHDKRRETLGGLIEQHRTRIADQRAGDGKHLLLAAGHARAKALLQRSERREKREDARLVPGRQPGARRPPAHLQVLRHRQR